MPRRDAGAEELAALDPTTGEVLDAGQEPPLPASLPPSRARRLRRLAVGLAALSLLAAASAGYAGSTISSLRRVERVWRTALALDRQRATVEEQVVRSLRSFGEEDEVAAEAVRRLGADEARRLVGLEEQLRRAPVVDPGLSALRDDMAAALRFRQSAVTANRLQLEDRELRPLTTRLARQLNRGRLPRREPVVAPLAEGERALRRLSQFADDPTGTVLVGRTDSEMVMVDIDGSEVGRRPAPGLDGVFVLADLALGYGRGVVSAFPLQASAPPRWSLPGSVAFPAVEPDHLWVAGADVRLVDLQGRTVFGPVPLPPQRVAGAATTGGLVLNRPGGGIELWEPASPRVVQTVSSRGRLVATSRNLVAWQEPDDTVVRVAPPVRGDNGAHTRQYRLRRTDAGAGAFSPDASLLALPAGPAAGVIAAVVVLEREGGFAFALGGRPTTFAEASLTWAPDGEWLFWKTRDGRIALQRRGTRQVRILRVDIRDLRSFTATDRVGSAP